MRQNNNYKIILLTDYTYDAGGNILTRKTLASGITHIKTDNYLYNATWHDRLDSYNGVSIEYDESGNPVNYMGKIMTWQGRKAISIDGVAMQYDYNGKRLCKGNKKYFWQGDTLKYEYDNNGYIYYYHDESGVCGMCVNDTEYYFRKNIFGDVVGIYDVEGNMLCKYTYDAWGKHTITDAQGKTVTAENIGNKNPYRYRGQYYDTEFEL